ncbi:MAG: BamA/TamA family outer membrane protein [Bacteroidales bacterium]|nr:BamA/TamA family outer membrane protein [Bacteroidales bacterium]
MRLRPLFPLFLCLILAACNPSRHLSDGEYMLTKNTVKVVDNKSVEFDDLYYMVRPTTNKKFLDVFPLKAWSYVNNLPKVDSAGNVIKDTKFMQKRRDAGEIPVLLDTNMITYSLNQIKTAMSNWGYFDAEAWDSVKYKDPTKMHPKRHKAEITYFVRAGEPYYIRKISYNIDISEYKKIILQDTVNTLIKVGEKYNAETLLEERNRMVNTIRDQGYYYVSNDIVSFKIDTIDASSHLDKKNHKTLEVNIYVNFNRITDDVLRERHAYKFYFKDVNIYPNYHPQDTAKLIPNTHHRGRNDNTKYVIHSVNRAEYPKHAKDMPVRDIRPRILVDNILTKSGVPYSQTLINRSRKKLNDLKNFSYIDISIQEATDERDTINKVGYLNTYYKLTRNKLHSLSAEVEARSDKAALSLTYSNKNLFRSAEYFNVNVYGGLGFRIRSKKKSETGKASFVLENQEAGAEISMDFRRLLFFKQTQKIEATNYGTSLKLGAHYENSYLYRRLIYNLALVYSLSHNSNLVHTITPLDLSSIIIQPKGNEFYEVMSYYSKDFQSKYENNLLLSFKYGLTYTHPCKDIRNSFIVRLRTESSGMLLSAICAMANAKRDDDGHYTIFGKKYGNFELAEIDLRFTHLINKKNSVAMRFNFGLALPLWNATTLPFEKSFYLGGSNSMRAWDYRTLGPGSYYNSSEEKLVNDIRTGDIKLEMNLEYRGTIYKFIKYGVFVDAGNIWLSHKDPEMPNAEFSFKRFYKEIGLGVGAGLRFDFSFFIIRLDAAVPIYDPGKPTGNQWIGVTQNPESGKKELNRSVNLIFGIGHAF